MELYPMYPLVLVVNFKEAARVLICLVSPGTAQDSRKYVLRFNGP